jgi:hypothetical protein
MPDIELSKTGYCTFSHVCLYTPHRTFNTSSAPTKDHVLGFIEDIFHQMNGILDVLGYVIPVPSGNATAIGVLRSINALGAASLAEETANSIANKTESDFGNRLDAEFMREFEELGKGQKVLGGADRTTGFIHRLDERTPKFRFHRDAKGNKEEPVFKKDMKF